jgi:hypothetical protein
MFDSIRMQKRGPGNKNAAGHRASLEDQSVSRGTGVIGEMWNKLVSLLMTLVYC